MPMRIEKLTNKTVPMQIMITQIARNVTVILNIANTPTSFFLLKTLKIVDKSANHI